MGHEVTTELTSHEALEQATASLGRGGVGLHAILLPPQRLVFQGDGHVPSQRHPAPPRRWRWRPVRGMLQGNAAWGRSALVPASGPAGGAGNALLHRHPPCAPSSTMRRRMGPIECAFWGLRRNGMGNV